MNSIRLSASFLCFATLLSPFAIAAQAESSAQTIKFSDPTKPGTLKINLGRGELSVQGTDTSEVVVKSDSAAETSKPRQDGMRVLSAASSYALNERDNVITLDAGKEWGGRGGADFHLTVPRNTTIIVQNAWGGEIACSGISGDIEINSMQGEIRLDDVSGGVVVGTMNGEIRANIRELNEGKPLSFTSMNGEVVVRVPESAKANVRLRTQNGTVLTDFPDTALITKTEAAPGQMRGKLAWGPGGKVLTAEIQDAIREATQLSATAVKEALEAIREGLDAARLNTDEAQLQMEVAKREMERARRELERERRNAERRGAAIAAASSKPGEPVAPVAPAAPKPKPFPTITGGKLVTGTLNGGGPEISVSTMNGDVILRKMPSQ